MKESFVTRRSRLGSLLGSTLAVTALLASADLSAAPVITGLVLEDQTAGTLDSFSFNNLTSTIDIDKTFQVDPMSMRIRLTVGSAPLPGGPFTVNEVIQNNSGTDWTNYHIGIENAPGGVAFGNVSSSTLSGFTLDSGSGPSSLDFTGSLANGASASAKFMLSLADPGKGNSYTLELVQTPTTASVPVPMAAWLFGSGLAGLGGALRRRFV